MTGISATDELARAAKRLADAGIDSARLDARVLLAHVMGIESTAVVSALNLDQKQAEQFAQMVSRRAAREPLAYIIGKKEFFSLDFDVGPGALIPRPETETLVEQALLVFAERSAELKAVDLGAGSGCLIVSFLVQYPRATGLAVDMSEAALAWARRNVMRHGLTDRCRLIRGGWAVDERFDVVFCNPPYLTEGEFLAAAPEIAAFEPEAAFVGGCDGLAAYRELARHLGQALKPEGKAFIEIGAGQQSQVTEILGQNGLDVSGIAPDLSGIPRCLIAGLTGGIRLQKTVGMAPATR